MVLRHPWSLTLLVVAACTLATRLSHYMPIRVASPSVPAPLHQRTSLCIQSPSGAEPDVVDRLGAAADYSVSVTPHAGTATVYANTTGNQVTFNVDNTGNCADSYSYSYTTTGPISGVTLDKTGAVAPVGYHGTVTATFAAGTLGTAVLTLSAAGNASDQGSFTIVVKSPVISLDPHDGDYRDVTKCVASCFEAVAGYSTPSYFSWDTPRSIQLLYRSAQAKPMGLVQVDVRDTSHTNPVKLSIRLQNAQGAFVTFTNNSTELFYAWTAHPADSNVNRLAAQFDATALATGAYTYTLAVRTYRADNSFTEYTGPIRVLVVNEAASPFGAGWSIAGFQHLYTPADGSLAITEGNGSMAVFTPPPNCGSGCTFTAPPGDFTTVTRLATVGADSAKYTRRYPDGTIVAFYTNGRLDYVKDRLNNQTTFKYNASQLLVAILDPAGKADSLSYNGSNKLRWIQDPGGRRDSVTIDGSGNLTRIADWGGGVPFQGTYDGNHRLTHWTDRRGGGWGLSYDFAGKLAADTAPQVTVNGQATRPVVRLASVEKAILIDPASGLGTSTNPGANVDTAAVRASATSARGFTATYGLDRFGAPTLVQEPLGRTTRVTRDSSSRVVRSVAPSGHIVKYSFSGADLTQQWDSTTGRTINYTYEPTYHQVTLVSGDVDSLVNHWTAGRLDSSRVGGSSSWSKYQYTSTGRDSILTDPGSHSTAFFYHASGFMNTDSTVLSGLTPTSYLYDGHGQRTLVAHHFIVGGDNPQVKYDTTWMQYDSLGRVARTIGPLHDTTTTTYDALYVTQVRDTKGWLYRSWPNALGWADSTSDPAGVFDRFQYDSAGNPKSWTNRRGQTVQFTYDSLDQARFVITAADTTKFFTDPLGRFGAVSNAESVDTVKADTAGRSIWEISCRVLPGSGTAKCFRDSSAYQIRDLRTNLIARADSVWGPSVQRAVRWHYSNASNLDTLTNFGGESTTFGYNGELMMSGTTLSGLNGMVISYDYPWSHVTDIIQVSDAAVNASLGRSYRFDGGMQLEVRYHGPEVTPDSTRTYSYDPAGRIVGYVDSTFTYAPNGGCSLHLRGETCSGFVTASQAGSATSYFYDSLGNRKDSPTAVGSIDPGNRLRRLNNLRMDYDAAGNLLSKRALNPLDTTQVQRQDSLFWGATGRLDSVHTWDSQGHLTRVGFGYDGWGRRVRKTVGTVTTRFLWDGDALLMDLDSAGNRVAEYTYYPGVDNPHSVLRHDRGDTTFYYVKDLPGNITGLVRRTATGVAVANSYDYTPFGDAATGEGDVPNRLLYAAREWDTETQLYYNRARYYDAAVGRFVSEDPIGLAGGINPYVYADNDPLDERDPSGLGWECEWEVWGDVTRDVGTGRVVSIANIRFRLAGCWSDGEWGGGGGESGSSSQASAQGRRLGRQGPSCPNSMAWPVSEPHRVTSGWGFRPSPFGLAGVSEGHWSEHRAALGFRVTVSERDVKGS